MSIRKKKRPVRQFWKPFFFKKDWRSKCQHNRIFSDHRGGVWKDWLCDTSRACICSQARSRRTRQTTGGTQADFYKRYLRETWLRLACQRSQKVRKCGKKKKSYTQAVSCRPWKKMVKFKHAFRKQKLINDYKLWPFIFGHNKITGSFWKLESVFFYRRLRTILNCVLKEMFGSCHLTEHSGEIFTFKFSTAMTWAPTALKCGRVR